MKQCLVRKLGNRVDRDLALLCVSLTVSVRVSESDLFNVQSYKRSLCVPFRYASVCEFFPYCLSDNYPADLVHETGKRSFTVLAFALLCFFVACLASDRHT